MESHEIGYHRKRRKGTPQGMRYCSGCDNYKSPNEFHKSSTGTLGLSYTCKECRCKSSAKSEKRVKKALSSRRSVKFSISTEEYQEMLNQQGGVCAICGQPETKYQRGSLRELCIDHDHETGKIRGLLCAACNVGLGSFKDSLERLSNAIDYLMGTHR